MNKWQVICPVVLIVIVAMVFAMIKGSNNRRGFVQVQTRAQQNFFRIWSASDSTPQQRVDAVNNYFSNGYPMLDVVRLLGNNYTFLRPYSAITEGLYGNT